MDTDLVLGVALAPAALGLVLVRGRQADGRILDRDLIETPASVERAKSAILQTFSTAVKHGYRIRAVDVVHVGVDAALAAELVATLRRLGMRNVVVIDPAMTASAAATYALDMVRVPNEDSRITGGRHRHTARSNTSRRVLFGAAATGVLTVLAATVVVNATSGEPPPAAPQPSAVPAASSPVQPTTTPRSVFTGSTRGTTAVPVTSVSVAPPAATSADPVTVTEPVATPADPSEHLPSTEGGPRLPGPA